MSPETPDAQGGRKPTKAQEFRVVPSKARQKKTKQLTQENAGPDDLWRFDGSNEAWWNRLRVSGKKASSR